MHVAVGLGIEVAALHGDLGYQQVLDPVCGQCRVVVKVLEGGRGRGREREGGRGRGRGREGGREGEGEGGRGRGGKKKMLR